MSLQLKICRDSCATWSVHGLSSVPVPHLPSLSASIDYARTACGAAPATIELVVDGMYIVVHQDRGWPRQILAPEITLTSSAPTESDPNAAENCSRAFPRLKRLLRSHVKGSFAGSREQAGITGASLRLG
jgi:hypothetical protein